MKILIVTNKVPYPTKDGGAIATLNLALGLASVGAEVTLLTINTIKHFYPLENIPSEITNTIAIKGVTLDTTIKPLTALYNLLFSSKPYNAVRFESKEFANLIREELEQNQFDIVQLEGPYLAPYINIIRNGSNVPIVLRAHNLEHEIWKRTADITPNLFKKNYLRTLAKRIKRMEINTLQQVDGVIPITEKDASCFNQWNPSIPRMVAPTGLNDLQLTPNPLPIKGNSLFHLGGLDWLPNQDGIRWFISSCWPYIRKAVPEAKFYVAGRNAPDAFINSISQPGIEYLGEVENAQQFMQTHGVMVVPLLSGSGMRIKIIEGMATSIPIVATSIAVEGIPAQSEKELIVADSADEITKACVRLLQNRELASELAQCGGDFARKNYDNNAISIKLIGFYEGLKSSVKLKTS